MESQIIQTANLLLKHRHMKNEYERALSWITKELSSPTPTEGFSAEEKESKLLKSQNDILQAMDNLEEQMQNLENQMNSSTLGKTLLMAAKAHIELQGIAI